MKRNTFSFLIAFLLIGFLAKSQTTSAKIAQNNLLINTWFEAPESSKGDTVVFKTAKHIKGPNESPAFEYNQLVFKNNTDISVAYWTFCPTGNWAYDGKWSASTPNKVQLDFGAGKCKVNMEIISVSKTELKAILKESTN